MSNNVSVVLHITLYFYTLHMFTIFSVYFASRRDIFHQLINDEDIPMTNERSCLKLSVTVTLTMVESGASRGQALSVTDPECEETDLCCLGPKTASP